MREGVRVRVGKGRYEVGLGRLGLGQLGLGGFLGGGQG